MKQEIHYHIEVHIHMAVCNEEKHIASPASLIDVLQCQQRSMAMRKSTSTNQNYTTAIRALKRYLKDDMQLSALTPQHLSGFERWLRGRGLCMNTVSCYMRSLRSLLTMIDGSLAHMFRSVYTGNARTEKRSLGTDAVARLKQLALPPGTFLELARDVFLFSFYAMGMPFVDVAHLKRSQVTPAAIVYNRQKTGQRVVVAIEPPMAEIMSRHGRMGSGNYVFPLLKRGTDHEYQVLIGRYNRALRRLAAMAGIATSLTSYVVRHTWASTAYSANIDLPVISKALGHSNTRTTLTYIREIDDDRLFVANRQIISKLEEEKIE